MIARLARLVLQAGFVAATLVVLAVIAVFAWVIATA